MFHYFDVFSNCYLYSIFQNSIFITVDQWEERRKKNVIRSFYKDLEKDEKSGGKKNFNLKNGRYKRWFLNKIFTPFYELIFLSHKISIQKSDTENVTIT